MLNLMLLHCQPQSGKRTFLDILTSGRCRCCQECSCASRRLQETLPAFLVARVCRWVPEELRQVLMMSSGSSALPVASSEIPVPLPQVLFNLGYMFLKTSLVGSFYTLPLLDFALIFLYCALYISTNDFGFTLITVRRRVSISRPLGYESYARSAHSHPRQPRAHRIETHPRYVTPAHPREL